MNSLNQLQQELRSLSKQIINISQELDTHRLASAVNTGERPERIKRLARKHPITNKRLHASTESAKKAYFGLLTLFANPAQQTDAEARILFLQRIAVGAGYTLDFEEWMSARVMIEEDLANGNPIQLEENTYSLLLDGLLIANLTGTASIEDLRILAELSIVLDVGQQELEMLAQLAKSLIHQSEDEFNSIVATDPVKWRGLFTHHIPADWLKHGRVYCGGYEEVSRGEGVYSPIHRFSEINERLEVVYKLKENSIVKKNDVIVKYIKNGEENSIVALRAGCVSYKLLKKNIYIDQRQLSTSVFIGCCFKELHTPKS